MLDEIDRVLAPDGVLLISTPDRRMYSQATGQDNPFHERELTESEFRALLGARFSHVGLWGQRTMCGSRLAALDADAGERPLTVFLERSGDEWRQAGEPAPMYLVAVASRVAHEMPAGESTLVDYGLQMLRRQEGAATMARAEADSLSAQLRDARAALGAERRSGRDEVKTLLDAARRQRAELSASARSSAAPSRRSRSATSSSPRRGRASRASRRRPPGRRCSSFAGTSTGRSASTRCPRAHCRRSCWALGGCAGSRAPSRRSRSRSLPRPGRRSSSRPTPSRWCRSSSPPTPAPS